LEFLGAFDSNFGTPFQERERERERLEQEKEKEREREQVEYRCFQKMGEIPPNHPF